MGIVVARGAAPCSACVADDLPPAALQPLSRTIAAKKAIVPPRALVNWPSFPPMMPGCRAPRSPSLRERTPSFEQMALACSLIVPRVGRLGTFAGTRGRRSQKRA